MASIFILFVSSDWSSGIQLFESIRISQSLFTICRILIKVLAITLCWYLRFLNKAIWWITGARLVHGHAQPCFCPDRGQAIPSTLPQPCPNNCQPSMAPSMSNPVPVSQPCPDRLPSCPPNNPFNHSYHISIYSRYNI